MTDAARPESAAGGGTGGAAPRRVLFVTGKLAGPALGRVLAGMAPPFACEVSVLGITVAALMTTPWIARALEVPEGTDLVLLPGLCEGDPQVVVGTAGVRVEKGPSDLREIPRYFGRAAARDYWRLGHRDRRRDQQRAAFDARGAPRRGRLLSRLGRRHHRHRLHAGARLSRPGRRGPRARLDGMRVSVTTFDPTRSAPPWRPAPSSC